MRMMLRRPAELSLCRMMRPAVTLDLMPHSVVASWKYALPSSMLRYPGLVLAPVMTIAPIPDIRMATALRPPACDSPRLPVCGDLNIATVLDPRGKSPSRGPVARTTGASGASGSMRTVLGTVATMHADDRLLCFFVPEDGADDARLLAQSTARALRGVQKDSSALAQDQCVLRAYLGARGVLACSTNDHRKTMFHAAHGLDVDCRLAHSRIAQPASARKHAYLAACTAFRVNDG